MPLDYPGGNVLNPRRHPPQIRPSVRGDKPNWHYRTEWEWDDELMPRNAERLDAWRDAADGGAGDVLDEVRERLDDDLDSAGAVLAVDRAAARGESTAAAASLLGVLLAPAS